MSNKIYCPTCDGVGPVDCPTCHGEGMIWPHQIESGSLPVPVPVEPVPEHPAQRHVNAGMAKTNADDQLAILRGILGQNASVNEGQVREIIRNEFAEEGASLAALHTQTEERIRKLIADADIPRKLEIQYNGHRAELPAVRHPMVETLIKIVGCNVPAFVVGPAGAGKTTACEQVAHALGLSFYLTGAVTGTHEFLGYMDAHGRYQGTPFRQAFEHGGLFLWDESDASDPAASLVINAAVANGVMAFPDQAEPVKRHENFRLIAAANTFGTGADREYVGRSQLDAATLDRFAFVQFGYDKRLERKLAGNDFWTNYVQNVRKAVEALRIRHIVSPRASIMGAKLLAVGLSREDVETQLIWKGISKEDRTRIVARMGDDATAEAA